MKINNSRRAAREGWPLLTLETEPNGDSKSTNVKSPPWYVRWACRARTRDLCRLRWVACHLICLSELPSQKKDEAYSSQSDRKIISMWLCVSADKASWYGWWGRDWGGTVTMQLYYIYV